MEPCARCGDLYEKLVPSFDGLDYCVPCCERVGGPGFGGWLAEAAELRTEFVENRGCLGTASRWLFLAALAGMLAFLASRWIQNVLATSPFVNAVVALAVFGLAGAMLVLSARPRRVVVELQKRNPGLYRLTNRRGKPFRKRGGWHELADLPDFLRRKRVNYTAPQLGRLLAVLELGRAP